VIPNVVPPPVVRSWNVESSWRLLGHPKGLPDTAENDTAEILSVELVVDVV